MRADLGISTNHEVGEVITLKLSLLPLWGERTQALYQLDSGQVELQIGFCTITNILEHCLTLFYYFFNLLFLFGLFRS